MIGLKYLKQVVAQVLVTEDNPDQKELDARIEAFLDRHEDDDEAYNVLYDFAGECAERALVAGVRIGYAAAFEAAKKGVTDPDDLAAMVVAVASYTRLNCGKLLDDANLAIAHDWDNASIEKLKSLLTK